MPDFKKQWPEILYKCIMAVLAIIFGYNQYQHAQQHASFEQSLQAIHQYLSEPDPWGHVDYLKEEDEK